MSLPRLAPLAAVVLLSVACTDPLSPDPSLPSGAVRANVGGPLDGTARIFCGNYIVAYSPSSITNTGSMLPLLPSLPPLVVSPPPVGCGDDDDIVADSIGLDFSR